MSRVRPRDEGMMSVGSKRKAFATIEVEVGVMVVNDMHAVVTIIDGMAFQVRLIKDLDHATALSEFLTYALQRSWAGNTHVH